MPDTVQGIDGYLAEVNLEQHARLSAAAVAGGQQLAAGPAQLAQGQQLQQVLQQQQQVLQQLPQIMRMQQQMSRDIQTLLHRTSHERQAALLHNGRALNESSKLMPVRHPDTGAMPPAGFPATVRDLRRMRGNEVDPVLRFYNVAPAGTVHDRIAQLAELINCP